MFRFLFHGLFLLGLMFSPVFAGHYKLFVLTGQSNSLGTTNGDEPDLSPGVDAADARVRFLWHNVADAAISIGDSGGLFLPLQPQQGGYYPGSASHWGPEIGFVRTLVRAGVKNVGVVKASRGGGGNTNWSKSAGGHMYAHVVATAAAAANHLSSEGHTFEFAGLLYLQGESDTAAEADIAGTRIKELVDNLRADLPNAANMKAVIGGIAAAGSTRDTVRARQAAIAEITDYIDQFPNLDLQAEVTDGLHFNRAAKLRVGERFAMAFFNNQTVARHYGKLVFIGDSITQGGNGDHPSYRYQVFKRLAENGVPIDAAAGYKFTGSVNGPQTTPLLTTPEVKGQAFENAHDGHYGWRASWVNGRVPLPSNRRSNNRGEGTILNWTGQANPAEYAISGPDAIVPYPDPLATGTGNTGTTYIPDTVCLMIGINDLGDAISAAQVVADIGTMVDQIRGANPNARFFINHLLNTNQTQEMRDGVNAVNSQLAALAAAKNNASPTSPIWVVDANTGFNPVTMTYDNIHPNATGEQHVGDRMAAALGVIESPASIPVGTPLNEELPSSSFVTRYEGNQIWTGTALANGWSQAGTLTRSLPEPTDLRVAHPSTDGRWLEGTAAGWSAIAHGSWTLEARLKCHGNANGFILWCGAGARRILVEIHGNRTQDHADGGQGFNATHNNLDGNYHVFRVAHDAANSRYHVFRDGSRLSSLAGIPYDQTSADSRLILGDYTGGTFGNYFDVSLDYVRFTPGAFLPVGLDTDKNGLSDTWEYRYFNVLTGTDPDSDPDEDASSNFVEFQNSTDPLVAENAAVSLPVFVLGGAGNARGIPGSNALNSLPLGAHPAEQSGGIPFHDGHSWTTLAAANDGSFGPEIAFARLLWDRGWRGFGIAKSTAVGGGNTRWHKDGVDDTAYRALVATATAAASNPPAGFDEVHFRALLFIQGEENDGSEADAADTRFAALIENLKVDLPNASAMQGILGEIGGNGTNRDLTRARHAAIAASRSDIGLARNTGMSVHNEDGLGIHYNRDSLFMLGVRMAAEAESMGLVGSRPFPARQNLHARFIADHGTMHGASGEVTRWSALHDGTAIRDLARRVSGQTFRRAVTTSSGQTRQVMRFDGTNDLWSSASGEFGTLVGSRTVAILCRLTDGVDGFLFDGSTNTGRTRAQVRAGTWQAGVTPAGSSIAWNLSDPATMPVSTGWQRHIFTYTPNAGNTATTIGHWIDGKLVATVSENEATTLGGLIIGSNGGSPFSRLAVDVAEIAVFSKSLDAAEIADLDAVWISTWGKPTGPPLAARVRQTSAAIPRFGWHSVLEIEIDAPSNGAYNLSGLRLDLQSSSGGTAARWRLFPGPTFSPSAIPLAEMNGEATDWSPQFTLPLEEGTNTLFLAVEPVRHAPIGSTIDAALEAVYLLGSGSVLTPATPNPSGSLSLGFVPLFTDVVRSGELGIHTFRIPGIVCDSEGVLHAVYDHRYAGSGDLPGNIDIGYSRSTDGGSTWTVSRVILDFDSAVPNSSGNGVGDPAILHDPASNTLWAAALWSFGNRAYHGSGPGLLPSETGQYVLVKSTDGGDTWSEPINITAQVKDSAWRLLFVGPGRGIAMRDGTLVFPSQMRREDGVVRMCFVFSRDHGVTWQFGSVIPETSPQTNENELLELDDGRLLFSARTPSGSNGQRAWAHFSPLAVAEGVDPLQGGTWSPLYRLPAVPDPVCQATVSHWKSRHNGHPREWILFANPATGGRNGMTIRLSQDGGLSWPISRLLYSGTSAYSCLTTLSDGSIGLFFERDNYTKITFARFEEGWLLNYDLDGDADGLPDTWEFLHGLHANRPTDAAIDSDGDGSTNLGEYLAGTDPVNPSSIFRASAIGLEANESGTRMNLAFDAVPGRRYSIEGSENLANWSPIGNVSADRKRMEIRVPIAIGNSRHFFRVRALP